MQLSKSTSVCRAFGAKLGLYVHTSVINAQQFILLAHDACYCCELNPWSGRRIVGFQRLSENSILLDFVQWDVGAGIGAHNMEVSIMI